MGVREAAGPQLHHDGELIILDLGGDENLFDAERLARVNALLDEVEQTPPPRALITTGSGRSWCTGVDVAWSFRVGQQELDSFLADLHRFYARFLTLPMASVAALQGHVFANGVMLALAHDFRVMRPGQGFICLPNIDSRYPVTWGEAVLLRAQLPRATALEMSITGRRYDAAAAARAGLISVATSEVSVLAAAAGLARPLCRKDGAVMETIKRFLFEDVIRALCGPRAPLLASP